MDFICKSRQPDCTYLCTMMRFSIFPNPTFFSQAAVKLLLKFRNRLSVRRMGHGGGGGQICGISHRVIPPPPSNNNKVAGGPAPLILYSWPRDRDWTVSRWAIMGAIPSWARTKHYPFSRPRSTTNWFAKTQGVKMEIKMLVVGINEVLCLFFLELQC